MSAHDAGNKTAKGWAGRKYYLSQESIALLVEHCKGTPLTMSAYLDQLIKNELDSPAEQFLRHQPAAEVAKVLDEGQRQIEELTRPVPGSAADVPVRDRVTTAANKKDFKVDL